MGANIALLFRRLLAHLRKARQDWAADDLGDRRRFPEVLPVATSATIKSVDETGRTAEEVQRLRDEAVREFLGKLTGIPEARFKVVGEQICDLLTPPEAQWPAPPAAELTLRLEDEARQRGTLSQLAGRSADEPLAQLAREAGILWVLNSMLARRPMSVTQIVERIQAEVPERAATDPEVIRREVCAALLVGAALPDGMPGALRLRVHRFIRGGWQFTRCVDPGSPCPKCQGALQPWPEAEVTSNRYVQRILNPDILPLVAGEHTAQVTGDDRIELEDRFKAPPPSVPVAEGDTLRSTINVLACSPTLEMGIDVGGLDAVVMRNIPPRPDNYAQRGGRAGRRTRVGIVLGYARSTPHDGYFFDKPAEMIAGEVPAPGVGLGNRDVVLRHLHAMAFGSADPGLSGRMGDYINLQGQVDQAKVDALIASLRAQFPHAISLALDAWGEDVLVGAELASREALEQVLEALPAKVQDLFDRTSLQIRTLQEDVSRWNELGGHAYRAVHARDLQERLLGIPSRRNAQEADDRSSGHPMRRFAEFGILPGYEFPTEPCTLRLLGDDHEEDPLSVARRFGIAQFQPDALVHARGHRWKVVGLDLSSPWNPKSQEPDWVYVRCRRCGLRFDHQTPACPRCGDDDPQDGGRGGYPGHAFGGFLV